MLRTALQTYKNAYSGLSRETWLLSVIMLINRSGTMVVPFMTLYLTSPAMGYSIADAGIVFGLFGFGAFCGAYVGGKVTDKLGHFPVQLAALAGGGIMFFVLGQLKSYELICLFTFLLSFVNEAFRPANATAIALFSKPENRTRSYSLNRLAINLGWAFGSAVGGVLAAHSYELLFWVDGVTNISAGVLLFIYLKPGKEIAAEHKEAKAVKQDKSSSAYLDKNFLIFIGLTVLFAACFFQLFTNFPVFMKREKGFSEQFIGALMAINGLTIAIVEMVMVYKLETKGRNILYMSIGMVLTGIGFLLLNLPFFEYSLAVVMILFITFGEMYAMPFMNSYWIARAKPHNRGQYAALYTMAWSAAQTLGPIAGSQLAEHAGFTITWYIVAGLSVLTAILLYRMLK
jgi:predicted MFS family arabinose efflux permease